MGSKEIGRPCRTSKAGTRMCRIRARSFERICSIESCDVRSGGCTSRELNTRNDGRDTSKERSSRDGRRERKSPTPCCARQLEEKKGKSQNQTNPITLQSKKRQKKNGTFFCRMVVR